MLPSASLLAFSLALAAQDAAPADPASSTSTSTPPPATTAAPPSTSTATPAPATPADGLTPVVVLDLRADGVDPALAAAVSSVVGAELFDLGVLRVTTEEDVRRLMDFEQLKLVLACADEAKCLTSFQETLGAELLVTGTVGKAGANTIVGLVLTDAKRGVAIGRETATITSVSALVADVRVALGRLFLPVLRERGGTLVVLGNEPGATVFVDGAAVGTTPLRKDAIASGPHRIEAVKDGFIKGVVDVTVKPAQTSAVDVVLIPSRELSEQHRKNNTILRTVALGAAGAGALALASGGGVWWLQNDKMNNAETGYASTYPRDPSGAVVLPKFRYEEIESLRVTSYILMGAAVPLWIGAGVVWAVSEDPGKYDSLIEAPVAE